MSELPTENETQLDALLVPEAEAVAEAGAETEVEAEAAQAERPRAGIVVWRVGKPDAFLTEADAVEVAREALNSIAPEEDIAAYVGARSEGVRCVTHLFECTKPGYTGWEWFVTLTRVSRSKQATVNEVGLLPTVNSVLAPAWVPWAERVRPEDAQDSDD